MKNKTAIPILLVLFGLILTAPACKKYTGQRSLTAQAVDKTTMQPVPDTWLYLLRTEKGEVFSFSAQNYEIVEAKLSDADGKAEFTFDYQDDFTYDFYAINEGGYNDNGNNKVDIPFDMLKGELQVPLQPVGYVMIRVYNKYPIDYNDKVTIGLLVEGSYPSLIGSDIDTVICCGGGNGNMNNTIKWWVYKNNEPSKLDSIQFYLPAHDTTLVKIEY